MQVQENVHMYKVMSDLTFSTIRSNFLRIRKSAVLIQKMWRGYQSRKNYGAVRTNLYVFSNIIHDKFNYRKASIKV